MFSCLIKYVATHAYYLKLHKNFKLYRVIENEKAKIINYLVC